jgi:Putative peptidoglycan binding domain
VTIDSGSSDLLSTARPKSPYPGLRPFEIEEWSIFFGRERMIDEVIDRLAAHHLVMIHGSSGSGKSSLVRAGMNSPGQIEAAQQELTRLGCYSGAADGSLDASTRAAIQLYQRARGRNPTNDTEITDDLIADLKQQSATVCPIACPAGKIAEGRKCVDAGTSNAVVPRKDENKQAKGPRPTLPPRAAAQAPSGGSHSTVTPGVGF